jgi:hypothetical protein
LCKKTAASELSSPGRIFVRLFAPRLPARKLNAIHRRYARRRRPSELSFARLLLALVYHALMGQGRIQDDVAEISGLVLSASALSQRRQTLPWQIFRDLLAECLQPLARARQHPEAFYKGWRLLGLDGTCFGVHNVPRLVRALGKAASRRFKAAFALVRTVVIVELGMHNPIAAAIGRRGESELELAWELIKQLPARCLLLADRLYGTQLFVGELLAQCLAVKAQFLVRIRKNLDVRVAQVLGDGSALVELTVRDEAGRKFRFLVREVRGRIVGRGSKTTSVRLWTSLLDAEQYPAAELLALYGQRWEVEITIKELKVELRGSDRLASYTPETAAQEIAALLLAQSVLVQARCAASRQGEVAVLRISFRETVRRVRAVWTLLVVGEGLYSKHQTRAGIRRVIKRLSQQVTPERRARSCPRGLRQPVSSWPRIIRRRETHGKFQYEIIPHRTSKP